MRASLTPRQLAAFLALAGSFGAGESEEAAGAVGPNVAACKLDDASPVDYVADTPRVIRKAPEPGARPRGSRAACQGSESKFQAGREEMRASR